MKMPRIVKSICPRCKKHQDFKVSIYKKGKERTLAKGKRRYDRKKSGYGSQPKPIFHKNAKINKKTVPMLTCSVCGFTKEGRPHRVKTFELVTK
ncbi:MAG: 50S ribosomal protein L44e [Promethearchaeota archaeon]